MDVQESLLRLFPSLELDRDSVLASLFATARRLRIDAGERAFYPGAACAGYTLIVEGRIRCQVLSESGRHVVLYFVGPGQSCVLTTSCLLGGSRYPAEGIAETAVTALALPPGQFREAIEKSAGFRSFVFDGLSASLSTVMGRIADVVFGDIDDRLVESLLRDGTRSIARTHQQLADELGTAREVISRHLKRLEIQGAVRLGRGSIEVLDQAKLRTITGQQ